MQIFDKSDKIHLQIEDDIFGMAYIEIFNVNGQRVKKAQKYFNAGRTNIDKPNVPSGVYVINIYLDDQKEFFSQKMYLNGQ